VTLKIAFANTETEQKWLLSGPLTGAWARELKSIWDNAPRARGVKKRIIDLSEVTLIDENGEEVLRTLGEQGVRFMGGGVSTRHLLDQIRSKGERSLRKCLRGWTRHS
jgi:anti-anti-sigma regulatory factor